MQSSPADLGASPLAAPIGRRRLHTRTIVVEVYAREDGLVDLEARLTDVKDHDLALSSGVRPAGEAVHDMHLNVSVDADFNVVEAGATSSAVPYAGHCDTIGPDYSALKGLNLLNKFRNAVMQAMGGTRGCTHISELAGAAHRRHPGGGRRAPARPESTTIPARPLPRPGYQWRSGPAILSALVPC